MPLDPETVPVLVGAGRHTQKKGAPLDTAMSPVDIMATSAQRAEADSGVAGLLARLEAVYGHAPAIDRGACVLLASIGRV